MTKWSLREQLDLIDASHCALKLFPGASLRRLSAEQKEAIHNEFVRLTGNASRTKDATLAAFRLLVNTFERLSNSPGGNEESNIDDRVLDAVAELIRDHPPSRGRSTTGTVIRRRSARVTKVRSTSREQWTPEELEVLARALADIGLSAEERTSKQLYPTYVALGGTSTRSRSAVTQAAKKMLKAWEFVNALNACHGSWKSWLRLRVSRRRELVARISCRVVLLSMNRAVFRALDEAFTRRERDETTDSDVEGMDGGSDEEMDGGSGKDTADALPESDVEDAQRASSEAGVDFSKASAGPLRQGPGRADENGAADACSFTGDHKAACLLQAALELADVAESIVANTAASRARELKNFYPTVLQALADRDDQGCDAVKQVFQKQGEYLKESTSLLNAQREGTACFLAKVLSKGAPPVQEDQQ